MLRHTQELRTVYTQLNKSKVELDSVLDMLLNEIDKEQDYIEYASHDYVNDNDVSTQSTRLQRIEQLEQAINGALAKYKIVLSEVSQPTLQVVSKAA